jgi:hypothetical protein
MVIVIIVVDRKLRRTISNEEMERRDKDLAEIWWTRESEVWFRDIYRNRQARSLADDLHQDPLFAAAVELAVEDLFPGAEV